MRVALAGLATSHPFTDAGTLRELSGCELVAWEPDAERLDRFRAEHPDARVVADLAALVATGPDGAIVTPRTPDVADVLQPLLAAGVPCLVNKPAAVTAAQLARLDEVVGRAPRLVLTTSVLRYAPAVRSLRDRVDRGRVLAARITVRHDTGLWAGGYNRWQDDPAAGGGMLAILGVHGIELLVALLGTPVRVAGAASASRWHTGLRSEDVAALVLTWPDGVLGTVEVLGVAGSEAYTATVHGVDGSDTVELPGSADPRTGLGYRETIRQFLAMVDGQPSPVPWSETRAVLAALIEAATMARATAPGPHP